MAMNNIVLNMTHDTWEQGHYGHFHYIISIKTALEARTSAEFPTEHNSKRKYVSYASLANTITGGGGCGARWLMLAPTVLWGDYTDTGTKLGPGTCWTPALGSILNICGPVLQLKLHHFWFCDDFVVSPSVTNVVTMNGDIFRRI